MAATAQKQQSIVDLEVNVPLDPHGAPARPKKKKKKSLSPQISCSLKIFDAVASLVIVLPLTIGFWRGVWQLMQDYSIGYGGPYLSLLLGNGISLFLYFFQEPLKYYIHPDRINFVAFYMVTRCLLLIHSFGSVNQWRGLWDILDDETDVGFEGFSAISSLLVGILVALPLKVFVNVLAPPLLVVIDDGKEIHTCSLKFNTQLRINSKCLYFMDCAFSVVFVQALVILAWRGLWNLADVYLYPDDLMTSSIVSLTIGYLIAIVLYILQPYYYKTVTQSNGLRRLVIFDMMTLLGFISTVLSWRGVWELYNLLIVFETNLLSEWVTTVFGAIGSILFGCLSSTFVRGVATDGEEDTISEWPISYISLLDKVYGGISCLSEPCVLRCLFKSQNTKDKHDPYSGSANHACNIAPPSACKQSMSNHSLGYPGLRDVDSSSDEEVGLEPVTPPPPCDDASIQRNSILT